MDKNKYRVQIGRVYFLVICSILIVLLHPNNVHPYNWPWDQGHDCVQSLGGEWGYYNYDGIWVDDPCCWCRLSPVFACNGSLQKRVVDLTINGKPKIEMARTYNSHDLSVGLLGRGWTFSFGKQLISARKSDGTAYIMVRTESGQRHRFFRQPDGSYEIEEGFGVGFTLSRNSNGRYQVKYKSGETREFDEGGKLLSVTDRKGHHITLVYSDETGCLDNLVNSSGKTVAITRGAHGRISSIKDSAGRVVSYSYDDNANLCAVTDPIGNVTTYQYNDLNQLVAIIDPAGKTILQVTYDAEHRVASYTERGVTYTLTYNDGETIKRDPQGNTWVMRYSDLGFITEAVDPLGNVTTQVPNYISSSTAASITKGGSTYTYAFDSHGHMVSATDPLGTSTYYTHDPDSGRLVEKTDTRGIVTRFEHDEKGNITRIVNAAETAEETTVSFTYDEESNMTSKTDPVGHTWHYQYDVEGNLTAIIDPLQRQANFEYGDYGTITGVTLQNGLNAKAFYDLNGRLVKKVDFSGAETEYSYDSSGNLASITGPRGAETTYEYDSTNRLISKTDPSGRGTEYAYDNLGNVFRVISGSSYLYLEYDALGRVTRKIWKVGDNSQVADSDDRIETYVYDSLDNVIEYETSGHGKLKRNYDKLGRLVKEIAPDGRETTINYDPAGNVDSIHLPGGDVVDYTYDLHNRLVKRSINGTDEQTLTYDKAGRKLSIKDAYQQTTMFEWNSVGHQVGTIYPTGSKMSYERNDIGFIAAIIKPDGKRLEFEYDPMGRVTSVTNERGDKKYFTYDLSGNRTSFTDANDNTTAYDYDVANRLVKITKPNNNFITLSYDINGNVISRMDSSGNIVSYSYDEMNNLTEIDYPNGTGTSMTYDRSGRLARAWNENAHFQYFYDSQGDLIKVVQDGVEVCYNWSEDYLTYDISYPAGLQVSTNKDIYGRVTKVNVDGNTLLESEVSAVDKKISTRLSNGLVEEIGIRASNHIESISISNGQNTVLGLSYIYDSNDNLQQIRDLIFADGSVELGYDSHDKLLQYRRGSANEQGHIETPLASLALTLDGENNWLSATRNGSLIDITTNSMDQYTKFGLEDLSYDVNGNLVEDGAYRYVYNCNNRLLEVIDKTTNQVVLKNVYGPLGRRILKTTEAGMIKYIYDRNRVIEERDEEGTLLASYVYRNETGDNLLAMYTGTEHYFLHQDARGSNVLISDDQGFLKERYIYGPYGTVSIFNSSGQPINQSAVKNTRFFQGKEMDLPFGLHYFMARHYSSKLGRFVSADPMGHPGGSSAYEYGLSNPYKYYDSKGLQSIELQCISVKFDRGFNEVAKFLKKFTGGKASMTVSVVGKACNKCCIEGSRHPGDLITDYQLGLTGDVNVNCAAPVVIPVIPIPLGVVTTPCGCAGVCVEAKINGSLGGNVGTDFCNDAYTGRACLHLGGSVGAYVGGDAGWGPVEVEAKLGADVGPSGEVCAVGTTGKAWDFYGQMCLGGSIAAILEVSMNWEDPEEGEGEREEDGWSWVVCWEVGPCKICTDKWKCGGTWTIWEDSVCTEKFDLSGLLPF